MMMKLDIAKDYDKLNREFIERMLGAYGFSPDWVEWVMGLVSSPFLTSSSMAHRPLLLGPLVAFAKETICLLSFSFSWLRR